MSIQYHYNIRNEVVVSTHNKTTNNNYTNFSKHKSLRTRFKQVATVSLIFLSMVTGEVFAGDKLPKSKASSGRKQEVTFEYITLSNNLPDVVPVPPAPPAPSMPDLVNDATPQIKQKSGFLAAMKEIAKGNFKLKKVKPEPKPKVISSDEADLMSQILARREAIAGEKKSNKFKKCHC